jgi:hypothetical protein
MSNPELFVQVERALASVRNGHLTAAEAAARVERCGDLIDGRHVHASRELRELARELRGLVRVEPLRQGEQLELLEARLEGLAVSFA